MARSLKSVSAFSIFALKGLDKMAKRELKDSIGFPFTPIPHDFITHKNTDGSTHSHIAFRLFVTLRHFTSIHSDNAFPSFDTLRGLTGMTLNSVAKGLKELEQSGWLSKKKRFGRTTVYTLHTPTENHNSEPRISPTETRSDSPMEKRRPVLRKDVEEQEVHEQEPSNKNQIVAATPQPVRASLTRTPCPRCKASVPVMSSNGVPVAPCLTCNIDALAIQAEDVKSDTARVMGFFKHEFERRFGKPPRVTKGKDFGIMEGIVRDYGRIDTEGFIRLYMASDDEYVRNAGWSVAFFSTRVNALITATAKTQKQSGCEMCKARPGYVIVDGAAKRCACGKLNATSRQEQTTVSA